MKNINQFANYRINLQKSAVIKGGTNFCEWYITQRQGKNIAPGQMAIAMTLDMIVANEGEAEAMTQGGAAFLAKHS